MKSKFSTNLFILSLSLFVLLAWHTEATKSLLDEAVEGRNNKRVNNLTCHVCHSEKNSECFNITAQGDNYTEFSKSCGSDEQTCVVKKFAFTSTDGNGTTPMKTFSVKRNCTKKCEDGCVVMGERTRLYVCSQCCTEPLCNKGSSSSSIHRFQMESFQYFMTVTSLSFFIATFRHFPYEIACFLFLPNLI